MSHFSLNKISEDSSASIIMWKYDVFYPAGFSRFRYSPCPEN